MSVGRYMTCTACLCGILVLLAFSYGMGPFVTHTAMFLFGWFSAWAAASEALLWTARRERPQ